MSEDDDIQFNDKGLQKLIKSLQGQLPVIRVGILGNSSARSDSGLTNADVGSFHEREVGTSTMPVRSFLRVPLADNLEKAMENSGAFDKDVLAAVVASGSVIPYLKKIAVIAEGVVAEGFATGGYGKWKSSNMSRKKNAQTLVESAQLRNSITSEVVG